MILSLHKVYANMLKLRKEKNSVSIFQQLNAVCQSYLMLTTCQKSSYRTHKQCRLESLKFFQCL